MLCFRHGDGIKHFNILRNGAYFFVQDERFASIDQVVDHFSDHEVPNQEGVKHVKLRHPIACDKCGNTNSPATTPKSAPPQSLFASQSESNVSTPSGDPHLPHMGSSATLPPDMRLETASIKSDDSTGIIFMFFIDSA